MNLLQVQKILEEEDFPVSFEKKTVETPLDRLLILLDKEKSLVMELLFLPTNDDIEDIELLQMFVSYPFPVDESRKPSLRQLLMFLNTKSIFGSFGLKEDEDLLYYRYVLTLSDIDSPTNSKIVPQAVWVAYYLAENMGEIIESVINGSRTVTDIMV